MKVGIMQPYFFPYLGYWQLMNAVDTYVIFDDVAYIKRGWINRNRIKLNGEAQYFGIQVQNASQNSRINELKLFDDARNRLKMRKTLEMAYSKAPYYGQTMALFENIMNCGQENLAQFLAYGIREIAAYLGMDTKFVLSSVIEKDERLKAQDKILDICVRLGADTYINAIGGRELYSQECFEVRGIELRFLRMDDDIVYSQGRGDFIPGLSILDVMMYCDVSEIRQMLERYTLVREKEN